MREGKRMEERMIRRSWWQIQIQIKDTNVEGWRRVPEIEGRAGFSSN